MAGALVAAGAALHIVVAATHGPLIDSARAKLEHPAIKQVLVTDTVGRPELDWPGWRVVSVAELLASAIRRVAEGKSLADLYV